MDAFTDEDLKRLKEDMDCSCDKPEGCTHLVYGPPQIKALIARLEAAEAVASYATDAPITLTDQWKQARRIIAEVEGRSCCYLCGNNTVVNYECQECGATIKKG